MEHLSENLSGSIISLPPLASFAMNIDDGGPDLINFYVHPQRHLISKFRGEPAKIAWVILDKKFNSHRLLFHFSKMKLAYHALY